MLIWMISATPSEPDRHTTNRPPLLWHGGLDKGKDLHWEEFLDGFEIEHFPRV
jgi:hypothetical protein